MDKVDRSKKLGIIYCPLFSIGSPNAQMEPCIKQACGFWDQHHEVCSMVAIAVGLKRIANSVMTVAEREGDA